MEVPEKYMFKVWNSHRTNKRIVVVPATTENMYEQVVLLGTDCNLKL